MAFLLLELDRKPMKLKGQAMLPGISVPTHAEGIAPGTYKGVFSGVSVLVLAMGGRVFPDEAARQAFAAMRPVPVSIAPALLDRDELLFDVFVEDDANWTMTGGRVAVQALPASMAGFWLPVCFSVSEMPLGRGWVRQGAHDLEFRAVHPAGMALDADLVADFTYIEAPSLALRINHEGRDGTGQ